MSSKPAISEPERRFLKRSKLRTLKHETQCGDKTPKPLMMTSFTKMSESSGFHGVTSMCFGTPKKTNKEW